MFFVTNMLIVDICKKVKIAFLNDSVTSPKLSIPSQSNKNISESVCN